MCFSADQCSELSYPTPVNAMKTCIDPVGQIELQCTITCDPEYHFEGFATNPASKTQIVTCDNGVWSDTPITACVRGKYNSADSQTYNKQPQFERSNKWLFEADGC